MAGERCAFIHNYLYRCICSPARDPFLSIQNRFRSLLKTSSLKRGIINFSAEAPTSRLRRQTRRDRAIQCAPFSCPTPFTLCVSMKHLHRGVVIFVVFADARDAVRYVFVLALSSPKCAPWDGGVNLPSKPFRWSGPARKIARNGNRNGNFIERMGISVLNLSSAGSIRLPSIDSSARAYALKPPKNARHSGLVLIRMQ